MPFGSGSGEAATILCETEQNKLKIVVEVAARKKALVGAATENAAPKPALQYLAELPRRRTKCGNALGHRNPRSWEGGMVTSLNPSMTRSHLCPAPRGDLEPEWPPVTVRVRV